MENSNSFNDNSRNIFNQPSHERPQMLTFLCILTFISSGISALGFLSLPSAMPIMEILVQSGSYGADMTAAYEKLKVSPNWHFYLQSLFYATSLTGAILMFQLRKIGFHLYAIAQIIILLFDMFVMNEDTVSLYSIIGCFLWIGLYGMYYKYLTR